VPAADPEWHGILRAALSAHGAARLWAEAGAPDVLRQALVQSLALPVEIGYLRFYPNIERLEREGGRLIASLSLRECV